MKSVWSETELPKFDKLNKDIKTDVCVVGGGLAGILCAYMLKQKGINCILVEGQRIGEGVTVNTTAKITLLHGLIYDKIIKGVGTEKASMYARANDEAIKKYIELSKVFPCDLEEKPAITYSTEDRKKIEDEVNALNKIGMKASFESSISIPVKIKGAVKIEKQQQFNPFKFLSGISKDLPIYENTFVHDIDKNKAYTNCGTITANKFIIATHFPFINKHGLYFMKMYQSRSYAIALENAGFYDGMFRDEKDDGLSFRNYNNLLIIGGGSHRTGKKGGGYLALRNFALNVYPKASEKYAWATQDCMTLDNVPYIGKYSKSAENLYVATGFNKWGMTSSMVSAMLLSDMILGKAPDWSEVFDPDRSMINKQLFINIGTATKNLLMPTTNRCTHMGCALHWNPVEHSWDCECHGSRFDENGKVIQNPAMKEKKS